MSISRSQIIALGVTLLATAGYFILRKKKGSDTPSLINNDGTTTYSDMTTNTTLPRGYRNNNPLNIRYNKNNNWQGKVTTNTDGAFEQFLTMPYGYRAALYLLRKYIKDYNCNTVATIINKWAPPSENNTQSYINNVCNLVNQLTGSETLTPFTYISPTDKNMLCNLAYAMSIIENGNTAATRAAGLPNMDIIKQGWDLL